MDKKQNKYIFDLDGTLLTSSKQLTPNTITEINKLHQRGDYVFIATGRPYYMNKKIIADLNIKTPIINANGAAIFDPTTNKVIYANNYTTEEATTICKILLENEIDFLAYSTTMMFGHNVHNPAWFGKMIYPFVHDKQNIYRWEYSESNLLEAMQTQKFIKFLILAEKIDQEILNKVLDKIHEKVSNAYFVKSQKSVVDVMPQGSNKWKAIVETINYLNLDFTNIYTFGDALNDYDMVKNASTGIAMGNAVEEVKNVAKIIIDTNDNEGVAKFLAKI